MDRSLEARSIVTCMQWDTHTDTHTDTNTIKKQHMTAIQSQRSIKNLSIIIHKAGIHSCL